MPTKPCTPCRTPHCRRLASRAGYCEECKSARWREQNQSRPSPSKQGYGRAWRRLREEQLCEEPWCQAEGCDEPANEVDHIVRKAEGGTDDAGNLQSLCKPCHSRKTAREALMRGKAVRTQVIVVCGAAGSGKTTYVRNNRRSEDLVWDFDAIVAAITLGDWYEKPAPAVNMAYLLRNAFYRQIEQPSDCKRAWILTTAARMSEVEWFKRELNAEVRVLRTPAQECLRNIEADPRRAGKAHLWRASVEKWHERARMEGLLDCERQAR